MRPLGHYDLPTLSFFHDQQVYPLAPCSSSFPLATIPLAIHFGYLVSFVLSQRPPFLSLLRPFSTFLWHHAAIHLIVSTIPTPTQEVTVNSSPLSFRRTVSEIYQTFTRKPRSYSPVIPLTHLLQLSSSINLYILDKIDKPQLQKTKSHKLQYRSPRST